MPRNAEVIRQWTILRELESSRRLTIDELAEKTGVTTRTIRRDLEALQFVGFPLYDEVYDGKKYWMLEQRAFKRLDATGFTLAELSALYFSRTLVECLAATPFQAGREERVRQARGGADAGHAAVPRSPAARHPGQGGTGRHRRRPRARKEIGQLLDATLQHRRAIDAVSLVLQRSREGIPDRAVRAWCSRRARSTWSPSCRSTGSCARSPWTGSSRCR